MPVILLDSPPSTGDNIFRNISAPLIISKDLSNSIKLGKVFPLISVVHFYSVHIKYWSRHFNGNFNYDK